MSQPKPEHDLSFEGPIDRWDEGLPLGNGLLGAVVWGDGAPLKVSVDRGDLWDLREVPDLSHPDYNYATMLRWVGERRIDDLHRVFDRYYSLIPWPSKIPAGRLELTPSSRTGMGASRLRLADAVGEVAFGDGRRLELMVHATDSIGYLRVSGPGDPPRIEVVPPAFTPQSGKEPKHGDLATLGYLTPSFRKEEGLSGFLQLAYEGLVFAVVVGCAEQAPGVWEAAWSVVTSGDGADPWEIAVARTAEALRRGWDDLYTSHAAWWKQYWSKSSVELPNAVVERQWCLENYKFGATARRGSAPIALGGVWTVDNGRIPPWKGDYHHDADTQLSYWSCYSGNHLEEGATFVDWLWDTREEAYAYTRRFYGRPGLNVPGTADVLGRLMCGWGQYTHSATIGARLAQHFYWHWRYSQDRVFLQERAYPYLSDVCVFLEAITELDAEGKRFLRLSSSPEIHNNDLEAWLSPTSNYDLALLRWAFGAAAELARELDMSAEAAHWDAVLASFPDFAYGSDGRLLLAPGEALMASHLHLSQMMAVYPLGLITWEDGEAARRTISAGMKELEAFGMGGWVGVTVAWYANMAARAKDGETAERAARKFVDYCSRNSFHVNGDYSVVPVAKDYYRPFTLEGNFAEAGGIQEMLLQSYGGVVRVFPALPKAWEKAAFITLRAEGGFLVSARREAAATTRVEILAEAGGKLRLEDPFGGTARTAVIRRPDGSESVALAGMLSGGAQGIIEVQMEPGDTLTLVRS